jgi:predicted Zn finger-like uncharacterized protein
MLIVCSSCNSKIRVPDSAVGKKGKCPKCGTVITITAPEAPSEQETIEAPAPSSPFDFEGGPPPSAPPPVAKTSRRRDEDDDEDVAPPRRRDDIDDIDEEPVRGSRPKSPPSQGLSMGAMIAGIVGLLCCCSPAGIAAIVMGFIARSKGGNGMALAGIILGFVGLLLNCVGGILYFFLGVGNTRF